MWQRSSCFWQRAARLLLSAGRRKAEITYQKSFGSTGSGINAAGGKFSTPAGIAVNQASGDVYVVDRGNQRIQQFNGEGGFIRAWGFDVVKEGEDNKVPISEKQAVTVAGVEGTFTLRFGSAANTTGPIPFNAEAATVETALNALSSINTGGGSVSVTGGPGDETGSNPYVVTFDGGPLAGTNVNLLQIDTTKLGLATGLS